MDNSEDFTHVSLCTGYGGIDLGLKRVIKNIRTIAYSEIEAYSVCNLVSKIEQGLLDSAPIWSNLKTFPFSSFYRRMGILSGGFPCQPFSASGLQRADKDPRHLFPYIREGIRAAQPSVIFFENVEGIISSKLGDSARDPKGTPVLLHVLRELERLGYRSTAGLFTAAECGSPQQRKRVFILGKRKGVKLELLQYSPVDIWPAYRGEQPRQWEPPRFFEMGDPVSRRPKDNERLKGYSSNYYKITRQPFTTNVQGASIQSSNLKSEVDRVINGDTYRLDYDNLSKSFYNRDSELKLLGNGVVPATAAIAFKTLWHRLEDN
jgi:site-specific DNA-cytosine methylase